MVQCSVVQSNKVQCSAMQCSVVRQSAVWGVELRCNALLRAAVEVDVRRVI